MFSLNKQPIQIAYKLAYKLARDLARDLAHQIDLHRTIPTLNSPFKLNPRQKTHANTTMLFHAITYAKYHSQLLIRHVTKW